MSMKPGATVWPAASITRAASPVRPWPTATIRSPSTATSAARAGAPLPSISEPFLTRSDQAIQLVFGDRDRGHLVTLLDAVDELHARHDLAEHGVLAVEVRGRAVADVELAAGRVGMLAACHRDGAAQVLLLVELRLDRVARAARAVVFRAGSVHHEVRHDSMQLGALLAVCLPTADEAVAS